MFMIDDVYDRLKRFRRVHPMPYERPRPTEDSRRQIQVEDVNPRRSRRAVLKRPVWLADDSDAPVQFDDLRFVRSNAGVDDVLLHPITAA